MMSLQRVVLWSLLMMFTVDAVSLRYLGCTAIESSSSSSLPALNATNGTDFSVHECLRHCTSTTGSSHFSLANGGICLCTAPDNQTILNGYVSPHCPLCVRFENRNSFCGAIGYQATYLILRPTEPPSAPPLISEKPDDTFATANIMAKGVIAIVAGGIFTSSLTTSAVMRVGVTTKDCDTRIPTPLHPTQLIIDGSEEVGVVFGNGIIAVSFVAVMYILRFVVNKSGTKSKKSVIIEVAWGCLQSNGYLNRYGAPIYAFLCVFLSYSFVAFKLSFAPEKTWHALLGFVIVLACMSGPVAMCGKVSSQLHRQSIFATAMNRGGFVEWVLGPGEWVNMVRDIPWTQMYAPIIRMYKPRRVCFFVIEYAATFALSCILTRKSETNVGCGHIKMFSAVVILSLIVLEVKLQPHARAFDFWFTVGYLSVLAAVYVMLAIAQYNGAPEGDTLYQTADFFLSAIIILLCGKVLTDVTTELHVLATQRRVILEDGAIAKLESQSKRAGYETSHEVFLDLQKQRRLWRESLAAAAAAEAERREELGADAGTEQRFSMLMFDENEELQLLSQIPRAETPPDPVLLPNGSGLQLPPQRAGSTRTLAYSPRHRPAAPLPPQRSASSAAVPSSAPLPPRRAGSGMFPSPAPRMYTPLPPRGSLGRGTHVATDGALKRGVEV